MNMFIYKTLQEKAKKSLIKYDDEDLKKITCSHRDWVLHEDGNIYCKSCHVSEADVETYEDLVTRAEAQYDALREGGEL